MKRIKINVKYLYLLYFIPFIVLFRKLFYMGIDIWYMLSEGKYILHNGFPYTDVFTFHEGLKLVIQQWLSTVIYYIIHKYTGDPGLIIFSILLFIIIEYLLYKLCKLVSNNKVISILISSIVSILLVYFSYLDVRPQLFTYIILLLWIYILEKYNITKNNKILYILPILSILQINLHASYWWFIYIYSLPFIAEYLYLIYIKKQKKYLKQFNILIILIVISFFCGLINPYGIDSILYLFRGTNEYINTYVTEMCPPTALSKLGITIILIVFINYIIGIKYYQKNKDIKISYLFLLFGSLLLAYHSKKSSVFIIIFGTYYLAYYLRKVKIKQIIEKKSLKTNIIVISIPIIITTIGIITHKIDYGYQAGYVTCPSCYTNLEEYSKEHETKIYATYALGSYLEYLGLKPYIDPRAEVFLKSQNEKEDIFIELYNFQNNIIPKEEFIKKYNFTHILIDYTDLLFQYNEIEGYTQIDGNEKYVKLYIRNDLIEQKKEG